ncbi:unnamed protein product [Hyaloperonospora brassicae]|uniref:Uncharacterized protein n=1 Tax=Hyaloperonospora brassicae TaxID=162125 RepID=A0AAV0T210_HYABA|nr:unnamed protein product [Hyaloperonospora brassicae]
MRDAIANLQSVYKRLGRVFTDGPQDSSDGSRHTGGRDLQHPSTAESGAPSCSKRVDTPATGRGSSSLILNRHGDSRYAPLESVDHREHPPKDVVEEERPPPEPQAHHLDPYEMDRAIDELRDDLKHERDRRYALTDTVRKNRKGHEADRARDRADYATAQLQVERDVRSLFGELATARGEITRLNTEVSYLRDQTDRLERERKNLMDVLERGGYLHRKKKARTDSTT